MTSNQNGKLRKEKIRQYFKILFCVSLVALYPLIYLAAANSLRIETWPKPKQKIKLFNLRVTNNIWCHSKIDKTLANNENFPNNSIFFHETSCKGGLNSREACSVEAAAIHNPNRQVNVIFSGPITEPNMEEYTAVAMLNQIKNVHIARVNLTKYGKGTPAENFTANLTNFAISKYSMNNEANLLRLITLYKYGGIYMDLDMLTVKSFHNLPKNWIALEKKDVTGSAIMSVSKEVRGREFIDKAIREFITTYKPNVWGFNGPALLRRVMQKLCGNDYKNNVSCHDIKVMGWKQFYPIHLKDFKKYFSKTVLNLPHVYTHHMWNKFSNKVKIIDEESYYYRLAKENCPMIVRIYGKDFGQ